VQDGIIQLAGSRTAKGISQQQLADVLRISQGMYNAIEKGKRRPNIDVLHMLALIYQTSMDFIYHAFYRQHYIWNFPDAELQYAMRQSKMLDIQYLQDRLEPVAPPELPDVVIWETKPALNDAPVFKPYGLDLPGQATG